MILHYYAVIITETNNRIELDGVLDYTTVNRSHSLETISKQESSTSYRCEKIVVPHDNFSIDDYDLIKKEILKKELDLSDICTNQVIIKSLSVIKD
jgi:hypothetical protein